LPTLPTLPTLSIATIAGIAKVDAIANNLTERSTADG
jgi:hypothetical protein